MTASDEAVGQLGFAVAAVGDGWRKRACFASPVVVAHVGPVFGPGALRLLVDDSEDLAHCGFDCWRLV